MGVLWFWRFGSVSWSVVCVIMWVQSGFGGWCAFACLSAGFCWLFKCGSVWVAKGVWIWRHKKRARNQLQKVGSRSDLHSSVCVGVCCVKVSWVGIVVDVVSIVIGKFNADVFEGLLLEINKVSNWWKEPPQCWN